MAHSGKTITFATDLLPNENNVYNLGNSSKTWKIFGDVTGNASSATNATYTSYIKCPDTRAVTINPNDLTATSMGVRFDFKQKSITGLTDNYSGIMSYRPYSSNSDWSGGPAHQLAFDASGLHWRKSTGDTTWDSWHNILTDNDTAAGTNNNATLTWNTTYTIAKINGTDIKFTTMAKPSASDIGAATSGHNHSGTYVPNTSGANDVNTIVNTGIYNITSGSATNTPKGYGYANLLVLCYRKHTGNTTTDWASQIYLHNGNGTESGSATAPGNVLYYRTSSASTWLSWQKAVHAAAAYTKVGDTNKPVYIAEDGTATAISYTVDKSVPSDAKFTDTTYTIATGDSNGQIKVTPTGGTAYNINVKGFESGYINIHPENSPVLIPFIHNDIAFLTKRGGSVSSTYDGNAMSYDFENCFDGSGSYFSVSSSTYSTLIITLTLHKTFNWTNTIYIDFGASAWRAKNIQIEVMNSNYANDTWVSKANVTNNDSGHYYITTSHTPSGASNAGGGFNKIRFTLSSWNSTDRRIGQIGIYNYGSIGARETYMSRGIDDPVFRNITPNNNNTYSLGSSTNKWANVYATTFTGNLTGNVTGNVSGSSGSCTGNAATATQAKYLMNRGGDTVTIDDAVWNHGQTGAGGTNAATVWHQRWKQSGLTYTPSGGSATTLTDVGDVGFWLSYSTTSNNLYTNMYIDGIVYSLSGFKGNLNGNATTATSATSASRLTQNTELTYGNNTAWNGVNYFNINSYPQSTVKVNDAPTGTSSSKVWWHILRFNHANNAGYYTDLAVPFNANSLYYKRISGGVIQNSTTNSGWVKVLDQLNTTAPSSVPTLSWGSESTVFTLNGTEVKIKAMAKPTYTASDVGAVPLSGGIITGGGLEIKGHIAGDSSTTTGHGLYSGGMYHNAYNNIILHGDASTGSSGIAFVSDKVAADGTITNINAPSDRAFIQYHACGVTTATAEVSAPTLATSGEAGCLVIGIGNDSGDKIILQAPGDTDIVHQKGATGYPIPHTTNTNGSVGGTTTPVYVETGVIKSLSYTIAKSVPSDAKFTDTTYSAGAGLQLSTTTFSVKDNAVRRNKLMMTDTLNYAELNDYSATDWGFTADNTADGHWYTVNTLARDKFVSDYYACNGGETFNIQFEISTTFKGNTTSGGTDSVYIGTAVGLYCYNETTTSQGIVYSDRVTADANGTVTAVNTDVTVPNTARRFRVFIQSNTWGNYSGTLKIRKLKVIRVSAPKWYGNLSGNATNVTGTVAIANGGTGKTTATEAWTALGGGASGKHADSYFIKAITSTDNAIVRFDSTAGQIQNSTTTIDDNGNLSIKGRLDLNRVTSSSYGRISFYSPSFYTWFDYMSDVTNGTAPTGGKPSSLGNVTTWARRSLIESNNGYGWIWEAASNAAASANTTSPTARMTLSSNTGQLRIAPNASSTTNETAGLIIDSAKNGSSSNVAIELWRGNNASWQIANEGGTLHFRNNYTTTKQSTYTQTSLSIAYNTGNATFAGSVTATGGFSGALTGNVTGNCSGSSGSCTGNAATATKVAAKLAATTKHFLLGTSTTLTGTAANVDLLGDGGIYATTTSGELSAVRHSYNVSGTEKAYTCYNATDNSIDFIFV